MTTQGAYDVLIAGQGAAGYAAALYSARYQIKPVVFGATFGGETATGGLIENYPGYPEIDGYELMMKFREQAEKYEVPIVDEDVVSIARGDDCYEVSTTEGNTYQGASVILAVGRERRKLGLEHEDLVLVFQKGVGADLLGFQQTDKIEAWLPLFLFSILFGLSMDYHVFLLSRIRERFDQTGDNAEAVAYGLRTTAGLITGAALIMVAVFSGFAAGRLSGNQQVGFGLAVAIFLDATIVRSILVPSSMRLLGKWNWYLPSALQWLPDLRVEASETAEAAASDD